MKILDATAGSRSIWYQKNNPYTVYFDKRYGKFNSQSGDKCSTDVRYYTIHPNVVGMWEYLPFKSNSFDMIIFDPPHLVQKRDKKSMGMIACYGVLYSEDWKQVLSKAVLELFRVLKEDCVFILKWCENNKKVDEILKLFPYSPMFGTRTGQRNDNHWICFMKHILDCDLEVWCK